MSDEQRPAKKVVKRVVKKAPADPAKPTMRYGRPVAPPTAKVAAKPAKTAVKERPTDRDDSGSRPRPGLPRPSLKKPTLPQVDLSGSLGSTRERMSGLGQGAVSVWRRIIAAITDAFWWVVDTVRSWRLPQIDAVPASLTTGVVVGLIAVGLGVGALELFSWLRGVASGGGTWGSLTFVFVGFIAFAIGERLLAGFGVPSPRLTSLLGVIITVVVMLGVYLEESDSAMAFLLVPTIAATAYTVGHWLMAAAEVDDSAA